MVRGVKTRRRWPAARRRALRAAAVGDALDRQERLDELTARVHNLRGRIARAEQRHSGMPYGAARAKLMMKIRGMRELNERLSDERLRLENAIMRRRGPRTQRRYMQ